MKSVQILLVPFKTCFVMLGCPVMTPGKNVGIHQSLLEAVKAISVDTGKCLDLCGFIEKVCVVYILGRNEKIPKVRKNF